MQPHYTPENHSPEIRFDAHGIYRITCTVTGRIYIGSAFRLGDRWRNHRNNLRRGTHHNRILQRAWDKYTEDAFVFDVLEYVLIPELLTTREQHYFDTFQPFGEKGFNIDRLAGSPLGRKVSDEQRAKLALAHRGKKLTATHRENIRNARLGKKATPSARENMRKRVISNETRAKIGSAHRGKVISPEHKARLSAIHKGRQSPTLGKPGTNLGKTFSPETRAKMSAATTGRMKTLIITSPDGTEYIVTGISGFCKEHAIHYSHLLQVAKGKRHHTQGWTARLPEPI